MERVLVTGGMGFIGSHLVKELKQGYDVFILDKKTSEAHDIRGVGLEDYFRCDYVVHLAAKISVEESIREPCNYIDTNVKGTANVLEFSRKMGVKKFVFASSAAAKFPLTSPYAFTKNMGEEICGYYSKQIPVAVLRLFNVYGHGQSEQAVVPRFYEAIKNGVQPTIYGGGTPVRDYVYIKDVVRAILWAFSVEGVYEIGTGVGTSTNKLWGTMCDKLETYIKPRQVYRHNGVEISIADTYAARQNGFAAIYGLNEGLDDYINKSQVY